MSLALAGKTAIITGGAQGLGMAIANAMSDAGASVAVLDIVEEAGQQVVDRLTKLGRTALYRHCDVRTATSVRDAVASVAVSFGGLDILVNNAGISGERTAVTSLDEEAWLRVLDVNLNSAFRFCNACMERIAARGGGSVINIASVHHVKSAWGSAAYAASKGGLVSLTRQLAVEWGGRNVRVNSISPGAIDATMTQAAIAADPTGQVGRSLRGMNALGRLGEPREVGETAAFLASDGARYITGEDILVDGGMAVMSRPFVADPWSR